MANATLTRGGTNFLSSSSTTFTLYNSSEVVSKASGLMRIPFPTADSKYSILADLMGASRDIRIEGNCTADDVTDLYRYVRDLVSIETVNAATLINGNQSNTGGSQTGYIYTPVISNVSGTGTLTGTLQETLTVYVVDTNVTYEQGDPNKIKYSVTMYEGSTSSF